MSYPIYTAYQNRLIVNQFEHLFEKLDVNLFTIFGPLIPLVFGSEPDFQSWQFWLTE